MEAKDLKNVILEKNDGKVDVTELTEEKVEEIRHSNKHLCFDCENIHNCKKVANIRKDTIDNYDFIDTGKQVIDNNGRSQEFIVLDCKDFVFEENRKITGKAASEAKRGLKQAYFGAESLKEANEMMQELHYKNSKGRR